MGTVILRDRQRRILRLLNSNQAYTTGQALAQRLGVSTRTVRNDIVEMNGSIDATVARITSYRGKGYRLEIFDRGRFHDYISGNIALLTREDRTQYLLLRLLWSDEPLLLDQLEDEMFISRTTLESDIRAMQSNWVAERLQFQRCRDTLLLVRDEPEIRIAFLRLYSENIDFNSRSGVVSAEGTLDLEQLRGLRSDLRRVLARHAITMDDFSFIYFALAAWLSVSRRGRLPELGEKLALKPVIRDVGDLFAGEYKTPLPVSELEWLQTTLEGLLRTYDSSQESVMEAAIAAAVQKFYVPFLDSHRFRSAFRNFIWDCSHRMAFPRFDSQSLLLELAQANPDMARLSHFLADQVLRRLSLSGGAVDSLSLLPSLIAARSRYIARHPEIQPVALVASHLSDSLGLYLYQRLSQHFEGRLRLKGPCPIYACDAQAYSGCDFVICTVDMEDIRNFPVPCITVSPHLTPADFAAINKMVYDIMQRKHFS